MFYTRESILRAAEARAHAQSFQSDMDDLWAWHSELIQQLHDVEARAVEDKVVYMAELEETHKQAVLEARERAKLVKDNLSLEIKLVNHR